MKKSVLALAICLAGTMTFAQSIAVGQKANINSIGGKNAMITKVQEISKDKGLIEISDANYTFSYFVKKGDMITITGTTYLVTNISDNEVFLQEMQPAVINDGK